MEEALLYQANTIFIFVSFLLAFFLITVQSTNKTGNVLLGIFLMIRGIDSASLVYGKYLSPHGWVDLLRHDLAAFSQAPLLYLFVLSIIYKDFRLSKKHLLHLIPFIISILVFIPRYYLAAVGIRLSWIDFLPGRFEGLFMYSLATAQNLAYIIATFILLDKYKRLILENFSNQQSTHYSWLLKVNLFCSVLFIAALAKNVVKFQAEPSFLAEYRLVVVLVMLAFNCWLVLKALYAPGLFRGIDASIQLASTYAQNLPSQLGPSVPSQIREISVEEKRILERLARLEEYMIEYEPFLDGNLTIQDLANQLDLPAKELSLLINHHLNQHFYEFINTYRIEKAKEMLSNLETRHLTILEILYKVGFNSKSSFNTSFKKVTGLTPSAYRKKYG